MVHDVLVIGGGVIGTAVARYLSLYHCSVLLLEKEEDVASGTTKANSGIVHAGYDPLPGTLKAKLNVRGARMMEEESRNLSFDYRKNGAMVVSFDSSEDHKLHELYRRGIENGVSQMEIISGEKAREIEPSLSEKVSAALLVRSSGIVCPFSLTIALMENAIANGAEIAFGKKVVKIEREGDIYTVFTEDNSRYEAKTIVNAAGVYGDEINNMVSSEKLQIEARRGSYMLFDKASSAVVSSTIFQLPTKEGKGVLVTPTVHGNLMVGPNNTFTPDKDDTATTEEELDSILASAMKTTEKIPLRSVITSFAGLRAHEKGGDFVIGEAKDAKNFFNACGIESPGLSSALAIGEMVSTLIEKSLGLRKKENPVLKRKAPPRPRDMTKEERNELIRKNPAYGRIVCRCEGISEGEIIDAISGPLGARTLDGIKRRVRAGMGRCQGGFCSPSVMALIEKYGNVKMEEVRKNRKGSEIILGEEENV